MYYPAYFLLRNTGASQVICFTRFNLHHYCLSPQFIYITVTVHYVAMCSSPHDLCWYFNIALFNQNFFNSAKHSSTSLSRMFEVQPVYSLQTILFRDFIELVIPYGCWCIWPWRICLITKKWITNRIKISIIILRAKFKPLEHKYYNKMTYLLCWLSQIWLLP